MSLDREIIYEEVQINKQIKKQREKIIEEIIKQSKPKRKKDCSKKEIYKLPMPSHNSVIQNRDLNIKTLCIVMLNSNWGGKILNRDDRYIYENELDKTLDSISSTWKVNKRTLKKHISKLKKCDVNILEAICVNGEIVYKINYKDEDFKNFVTIDNTILEELSIGYSENSLRLYIILSYMCIKISKEKNTYVINHIEKNITQEWLCEKMGISYSSRKILTICTKALLKGGFIKTRTEYKKNLVKNENGKDVIHKIPIVYYSLSDEYLNY